jgi:hypothetical protein
MLKREYFWDSSKKHDTIMFSSNGYSWTNSTTSGTYDSCKFTTDDVVEISIKDKYVIFEVKSKNFKLSKPLNNITDPVPCIDLYYASGEVAVQKDSVKEKN